MSLSDNYLPQIPSEKAVAAAAVALRKIQTFSAKPGGICHLALLSTDGTRQPMDVPELAFRLLEEVLSEMACGNSARVVSLPAQLTLREAAVLLKIPKTHFLRMLEDGVIPATDSDRGSKIKLTDLVAYELKRRQMSREALEELAAQAQKLKMGRE
ncbi:excisionase family DNA-binding protein [Pseudomonas nicosulfuronedens]